MAQDEYQATGKELIYVDVVEDSDGHITDGEFNYCRLEDGSVCVYVRNLKSTGGRIPDSVNLNDVFYDVSSISVDGFSRSKLKSIILPETLEVISNYAFECCANLTSIVVPEGVRYIRQGAFNQCHGLTSIILPPTLIEIGPSAFAKCSSLTSIIVPEGVEVIEDYAFEGCDNLVSIHLPQTLKKLGAFAFSQCHNLASIIIPESVEWFGHYAFAECHNLTSVTLPKTLSEIPAFSFLNCRKLESIELPDSLETIHTGAFSGCASLVSIFLPQSVTSIDGHVFNNCGNLSYISVDKRNSIFDSRNDSNAIIMTSSNVLIYGANRTIIPDSVVEIGLDAFFGRTFESVIIPKNVQSIENGAFYGCERLHAVYISEGVVHIKPEAFGECGLLTDVTNLNSEPQIIEQDTFSTYGTLHVWPGCKEAFKKADFWKEFTIVEDGGEWSYAAVSR